jgi:hypothetical protein
VVCDKLGHDGMEEDAEATAAVASTFLKPIPVQYALPPSSHSSMRSRSTAH